MKKFFPLALIMFFVGGVVSAQNPHINKKDQPIVDYSAEIVCFNGVVAGNGNASSVTAYLEVEVEANTFCYNPAGGAKDPGGVPGHQDFVFTGEEQTFNCKNGKANIDVCAELDIVVDCPNQQWKGVVEDLSIISVTLWINGIPLDVTDYYD